MMRAYSAQIKSNLLLMYRDRTIIFFGYIFPLVFFFLFAQMFGGAKNPGAMSQVVSMVLIIGVLGNGFFGAGMRTVQDRETNVLRRFKVAPISPMPVLVASVVSGLVNFIPLVLMLLFFGHFIYGMPMPANLLSMLLFISIGVIAFRSLGMIVAAVVNSEQEAQLLIQFLYLPMLFLSGATFPVSIMPVWVQITAQFLPATYVYQGLTSILIGGQNLAANWFAVTALCIAMGVALFVASKLFRWEKEEKIAGRAKLWILVVLAPFFLLGVYQAKSRDSIKQTKILARAERRNESVLFQNVRIFVGNGEVVSNGAVLIRNGKIERVFRTPPTDTQSLKAEVRDEAGRTLMPGLTDMHVHIGAPGGMYQDPSKYAQPGADARRLAAYLYCGITAVRSTGDWLHNSLQLRKQVTDGEYLGAEFFTYGPLFTAAQGHPSEMLKQLPQQVQRMAEGEFLRTPKNAAEAKAQVDQLKQEGVDGIKAVLEAGYPQWQLFPRLDTKIFDAVESEAQKDHLPTATHTGNATDVKDAVEAGTNSVEHGSAVDLIPAETFRQMHEKGIAYDPTLSMYEGVVDLLTGNPEPLNRSLVERAAPADLLQSTREWLKKQKKIDRTDNLEARFEIEHKNLKAAQEAGVMLIAGSDAGNMMVLHGPTVQHELELWVKAGIPPSVALQAATYNAAKVLHADKRMGLIREGYDASLILLDGDPLLDIANTERIASVFLRGEDVNRSQLFNQEK